jgi:hypothetical protein
LVSGRSPGFSGSSLDEVVLADDYTYLAVRDILGMRVRICVREVGNAMGDGG